MQIVMSVTIPRAELVEGTRRNSLQGFYRVWDGPLLPGGMCVCPFADSNWGMLYTVTNVYVDIAGGEVKIECESDDVADAREPFDAETVAALEADLRQVGWKSYHEFYNTVEGPLPPEQCGRLQLTFKTAGMPEDIFSQLYEQGHVIRDGIGTYTVNYFVAEAEEALATNQPGYTHECVEKAKRIDNYFIAGGAVKGQTIFIEHG